MPQASFKERHVLAQTRRQGRSYWRCILRNGRFYIAFGGCFNVASFSIINAYKEATIVFNIATTEERRYPASLSSSLARRIRSGTPKKTLNMTTLKIILYREEWRCHSNLSDLSIGIILCAQQPSSSYQFHAAPSTFYFTSPERL
ncbi:predicted protein [Lichtheimia corymbifera JMRC:FSU:9682]|uniref:Uncharacterized protein n=1 Tax=Lichtheimia corymbifera JMRC:FSU:9682 TaxID=1263082 RepID=A0A068RZR7_9FUNG|nr:predicted protein [Lichtheimia corymbifera JMRC:FSU:9682]